jgi:hypothetical protein
MIRLIIAFVVLYGFFHVGIDFLRLLNEQEKLSLTKTVVYSIICSLLTVITLTIFVILF